MDEATEAPIDHIKISNAVKQGIIEKLYNRGAFSEKTAIQLSELDFFGQEVFAYDNLVKEEEILSFTKDNEEFCFLAEHYKPLKSYRKEVVMGFSIPLLIFIIVLILSGAATIIYELIIGF